jgi:hypothetical protein
MSSLAAMKANATIGPTPQAPAHRRAPRQFLELLVEPRNLAFNRRQRL